MSLPPLHAADPMGEAANAAAMLLQRMDVRLLAAASANIDRPTRAENLRQALVQYRAFRRAMGRLEEAAPNLAKLAEEHDAKLVALMESRGNRGPTGVPSCPGTNKDQPQ